MSLSVTLDFSTSEWSVNFEPEHIEPMVWIGFTNDDNSVVFDNLSFGWSSYENGEPKREKSYPEANEKYEKTDQPFLVAGRSGPFTPDSDVVFQFWAKNAGKVYNFEYNFIAPSIPLTGMIMEEQ
jgi:hypothetical protein